MDEVGIYASGTSSEPVVMINLANVDKIDFDSCLKKTILHELAHAIQEAHDIHAWMIASNELMLTAHLVPEPGANGQSVLKIANEAVKDRFNIHHATFQLEQTKCSSSHE